MEGNIDWNKNPPRIVYHEPLGLWELLFGPYGGGYFSSEEEVRFEYDRAVDEIARGVFVFRRYRDRKSPRTRKEESKEVKKNFIAPEEYYEVPEDEV